MTTEVHRHRLSPSGAFIGDPALQYGPGSIGLVWRQHGTSSDEIIPTAATAITGLGGATPIAVNMQPGYLYEIEVDSSVIPDSTATINGQYSVQYRLRDKATQAWGAWTDMTIAGAHTFGAGLFGTATGCYGEWSYRDARFGLAVTATADAVEIGVVAPGAAPVVRVNGEYCFARVSEYLP